MGLLSGPAPASAHHIHIFHTYYDKTRWHTCSSSLAGAALIMIQIRYCWVLAELKQETRFPSSRYPPAYSQRVNDSIVEDWQNKDNIVKRLSLIRWIHGKSVNFSFENLFTFLFCFVLRRCLSGPSDYDWILEMRHQMRKGCSPVSNEFL